MMVRLPVHTVWSTKELAKTFGRGVVSGVTVHGIHGVRDWESVGSHYHGAMMCVVA
jgi:hypothetical protein